jgi:hypothetical protein
MSPLRISNDSILFCNNICMKILVLNAGSSSLKYQLFNRDTHTVEAKGNVEKI